MLRFFGFISFGLVLAFSACKTTKPDTTTGGSLKDFLQQDNSNAKARVYNLKGASVRISDKIILNENTKIINGTLVGDNALIDCPPGQQCFRNVTIEGTWANEVGYMSWFTNNEDGEANFLALTNLVTMGTQINLDKIYVLKAPANKSFDSKNSIIIKGKDPKTCGFILGTKHRRGQAYFKTPKGNNIHFEKISIQTADYKRGKLPQGQDYVFSTCSYSKIFLKAAPDMDYFKLYDCELKGAISFHYKTPPNSSLEQFKKFGIDDIQVKNCTIDQPVSLLSAHNVPFKKVEILNNTVNDLYGPVFFFPASAIRTELKDYLSTEGRPFMKIEGNQVQNSKAHAGVGQGYMSFLVAKANNFEVINNSFKNILNTRDSIETVAFYCSAKNHLKIESNTIHNCGSRGLAIGSGANSLVKLKGTTNCDMIGNVFRFDRSALQALGLIKTIDAPLNKIDLAKFRFSILGTSKSGLDSTHYYNIENNIFETAVISDYSWVSRADFRFTKNQVTIDQMLTSDPNKWGGNLARIDHTLFYFSTPIKNGNLLIEKNRFDIKNMDSEVFYLIYGLGENKEYDKVIYQDNTFKIDGIVSLFYPRSNSLINKNTLQGIGSFIYNPITTQKRNRSIQRLESENVINEYYSSTTAGPYNLKNFGSSKIIAKKNKDQQAVILQINFNDLYYYNDLDKLPISLEVKAKFITQQQREKVLDYRLVFESFKKAYFKEETSQRLKSVQPYSTKRNTLFQYNLHPINTSADPKIKLVLSSYSSKKNKVQNKVGYLIFQGLEEVSSFEIITEVKKFQSDSVLEKSHSLKTYLKLKHN